MATIVEKYPPSSKFHQQVAQAKLKLKNAHPKAIGVLIDRLQRKTFTGAKTKFFFAPPTPMLINALADLHIEATYQFGDELIRPEPPPSPWQAARAYVDYKEKEVNENPGSPLPRRNASVGSALSAESHKSVRFAEIEAEVRLFNKKDPPSYT